MLSNKKIIQPHLYYCQLKRFVSEVCQSIAPSLWPKAAGQRPLEAGIQCAASSTDYAANSLRLISEDDQLEAASERTKKISIHLQEWTRLKAAGAVYVSEVEHNNCNNHCQNWGT